MTPMSRKRKEYRAQRHTSTPSFMRHPLWERHPYIAAHDAFVAGKITIHQAASLASRDLEFIAECQLRELREDEYRTPFEMAHAVVLNAWRAELVAAIQNSKRETV